MATLRNKLTNETFRTNHPGDYFGSSNRTSDGAPIYERVPGPKYNVRMRLARDNRNTPAGTWVCLSVRGRIAWSKRTAQRHLVDVQDDARFTSAYDAFKIEED